MLTYFCRDGEDDRNMAMPICFASCCIKAEVSSCDTDCNNPQNLKIYYLDLKKKALLALAYESKDRREFRGPTALVFKNKEVEVPSVSGLR